MELLEEPEMFWAPSEQAEGLYGFLGDLQLSKSGSPCGLQSKIGRGSAFSSTTRKQLTNCTTKEDPVEMLIHPMEEPQWNHPGAEEEIHLPQLQVSDNLVEEPVDQAQNLEPPIQIPHIKLQEALMHEEFPEDQLMDDAELALQIANSGARVEDSVLILQLLEGPQDQANLNDLLSSDLHPFPLLDTSVYYQKKCRSGRRGNRKRRTFPWTPIIFGSRVSREYISRKNNSRWTAKEVEILVQGVSKFGVGRWATLKQQFFKTSIRTSVNLKDKWRNLLKAYQGNSQKTTQLYLEPSLVEQIRKLAEKHPY